MRLGIYKIKNICEVNSVIKGQCLCGEIQYKYDAEIEHSIICYCLDCQKAQGTAFGWNSPIDRAKFHLLSGHNALREYFHTPNKARVFCIICGSPIYSYRKDLPDIMRLRLGTVSGTHLPAPTELVFCEHQPDFICIDLHESSL